MELMRRIGGDVHCIARPHYGFRPTERNFKFPFKNDKCLFEIMPMWRRAAARRNVHIDHAEASVCLVARHGDRIGITDKTDVWQTLISVRLRQRQIALEIVWRDR